MKNSARLLLCLLAVSGCPASAQAQLFGSDTAPGPRRLPDQESYKDRSRRPQEALIMPRPHGGLTTSITPEGWPVRYGRGFQGRVVLNELGLQPDALTGLDYDGNGEPDGLATYMNEAGLRAAFLFLRFGTQVQFYQVSEPGLEDISIGAYQPAQYNRACRDGTTSVLNCPRRDWVALPLGGFRVSIYSSANHPPAERVAHWKDGKFVITPFFGNMLSKTLGE